MQIVTHRKANIHVFVDEFTVKDPTIAAGLRSTKLIGMTAFWSIFVRIETASFKAAVLMTEFFFIMYITLICDKNKNYK